MQSMKELRDHPQRVRSLTGLSLVQFDQLLADALPRYETFVAERREAKRKGKPRVRKPGAGRPYGRSVEDRLLLALVWLRHYPSYRLLECWFGIDHTTVGLWLDEWRPVLRETTGTDLPERGPGERGREWDELREQFPDLAFLVDATDQRTRRPVDPKGTPPEERGQTQRCYYSGKKKAHVLRTQIAVTPAGQILEVSETVPGGETNDLTLLRQTKTWDRLKGRGMVDCGYQGIQHDAPDRFHQPHRASRGHPLTQEEKEENRPLNRVRVRIEHTFAQMKIYQVLAGVYRHRREKYNDVIRLVAALTNRRRGFRPAAAS